MRRPLPADQSFSALFLPRSDHPYFEGGAGHPFEPAAPGFSRANAWWLSELSLLSYVPDEAFVATALARGGFAAPAVFAARSTHAFVADAGSFLVCVFRGTEPGDAEDLATDLRFLLAPSQQEGRVHRGFQEALDLVHEPLAAHLRDVQGDRPCWFTGHSLGGALATLAAARHDRPHALVTFGCPRVGARRFAESIRFPAFRVVNNNDGVARLPPPLLYHHPGDLVWIDRRGRMLDAPDLAARAADRFLGDVQRAGEILRRWLGGRFRDVPLDVLADHSPLLYAIHCWNALQD